MPKGSQYPGPPEALERYLALVEASGNGEVKGAKNPYTSRNGHMFSFLDPDGVLALRLSDEDTEEFRADHDSGPVIQYGKTMQGYSSVPAALVDDPDTLQAWYDRSWAWIGTLAPKATTKTTSTKAKK
ncbi:MAG: TfoX/Sxy family protein [Actinomycetota bacterium]